MMKIKIADQTGCMVPQFVVHAETEEEHLLLKAFCQFPRKVPGWEFHMHGETSQDGKVTSFNFGYWETPK